MKDRRKTGLVSFLSFHFDAKGSSFTAIYSLIQQTLSEVGSIPGIILGVYIYYLNVQNKKKTEETILYHELVLFYLVKKVNFNELQ